MDLIQNTAYNIIVGSTKPITDCVDGKTPVEVLILADITAALYKNATREALNLTTENFVHVADGYWRLSLTADDTDTVGQLQITLRDDDVFLAVTEVFEVVAARPATLEDINNRIVEVDSYFDTTKTPWQLVVHKKGDSETEYSRKNVYDKDGEDITSTRQVIARLEEPT